VKQRKKKTKVGMDIETILQEGKVYFIFFFFKIQQKKQKNHEENSDRESPS